jgi:CIC family chloride channel protein
MAGTTSGASLPGQPGGWWSRVLRGLAAFRGNGGTAPPDAAVRPRRPFGEWVRHVPAQLRALVRTDEIWLVVLAGIAGLTAGLSVTAMGLVAQTMHEVLYGLPAHERLSGAVTLDPLRLLLVLGGGGLVVGLAGIGIMRWRPTRAIDPIEANALYGGRMSFYDSIIVVVQTLISNGVGASVGLEAGYTQIGSALASKLGDRFRLRRNDQRLLVGCGAAGAIAAAFNAPLTGAFYAFELVIGTYSLATLAPVMAASIVAVVVTRLLSPELYGYDIQLPTAIPPVDYLPVLGLGIVAALAGIAIMHGVTLAEKAFRASRMPPWLRPAVGGLAVACLAMVTPQVLSAGHAALAFGLDAPYPLNHLALLFLLKATASAISLGSGFRGGLFFASLFLGALIGKLFAGVLAMLTVTHAVAPVVLALVGMSALAVAIVGGPLTMAFLALESTGSLPLTVAVLMAAVVSSVTVRRTFGYSFATWRFHLRGEAIRSAVDIGWVRTLTVSRMMRREVRTMPADTTIAAFRRDVPLGATNRVVVVDAADRYVGIVLVAEAHAPGIDETARLPAILHYADDMLTPQMSVKDAIGLFEKAESDALAVVDSPDSRRVIGLLTEAYALRRYSEELDRRRKELSGE